MRRKLLLLAVEIAGPLAGVVGVVVWTETADSFYFPPASDVVATFVDTFIRSADGVAEVVWPTLRRMFLGYFAAIAGGVGIGLVLVSSQRLMRMFSPIVEFLRAMPSPTMIPFIVLVFGVGDSGKIALIALGCIWPILLNTIDGMRSVDPVLLDTSRSYGVGRLDRIRYVRLPAAAPQIFAGMRTSLAIALILAVVSEMLAGTNGIGSYIVRGQNFFNLPQMWAGVLVLGIVGYTLNAVFLRVESLALSWHRGLRAASDA